MTRPFIQQMISAQAAYGGIILPSNFQNLVANRFHAEYIKEPSGDQHSASASPLVTQFAFDEDGANQLGADLVNVDTGYLLMWMFSGGSSSTSTAAAFSLREGVSTSTDTTIVADTPGTRVGDTLYETNPVTPHFNYTFSMWLSSRPVSPRDSEWGMFFSNVTANNYQCFQGTLIALPAQNSTGSLAHSGPTIGLEGSEWFGLGFTPTTILFNDQPAGDGDQLASTSAFTIDHGNENYLLIYRHRLNGITVSGVRSLRWYDLLDGADVFNVRTNAVTAGATRTGRGFQARLSDDDFTAYRYTEFVVKTLSAGSHTGGITFNRHESADNFENADGMGLLILRTSMLSQFTYSTHNSAIVMSSDANIAGPWSVSVVADGTTQIIIGFCTTVHNATGYPDMNIFRDGAIISEETTGEGAKYSGFSHTSTVAIADGSDGVGDTDNQTMPVTIWIVDTPSAGSHTYTVRYRRNSFTAASGGGGSNSSIINCRDDGSSGFIGTLLAFELKLATVF